MTYNQHNAYANMDFRGTENNIAARKSKREQVPANVHLKQPAVKRPALGNLSLNSIVPEAQGLKQNVYLRDPGNQQPKSHALPTYLAPQVHTPAFSIFEDDEAQEGSNAAGQSLCGVVNTEDAEVKNLNRITRELSEMPIQLYCSDIPQIGFCGENASFSQREDTMEPQTPESDCNSPMLMSSPSSTEKENLAKSARVKKIRHVPEISDPIYKHLLKNQGKYLPKSYMKKQTDLTSNMRSILIDWLIEVAVEYKLQRETLMLAVNYTDRFLGRVFVGRKKLQLVGAAAMWIAAKYEEIYPPELAEFVYITDNTYTKEEVLGMEFNILKQLSFNMASITICNFCEHLCHKLNVKDDCQTYHLTMMLAELTLLEYNPYLKSQPNILAAACLYISRYTLRDTPVWPQYMCEFNECSLDEMKQYVECVHATYRKAHAYPQQACIDKYKQEKHMRVACIMPPRELDFSEEGHDYRQYSICLP